MTAISPVRVSDYPSRLRLNRNFLYLWTAYGISAFGDHLSELGLMALMHVKEGHDQTRVTAAMSFVFFLPFFLLGPVAGLLADRLPRKYIMIAADVIRACIVVSIPLLPMLAGTRAGEPLPLYVGLAPLLMVGLFSTFFSPARLSILPSLVPEDQLTRANSMINGMGPLCAMISFLVGGWLAEHYLMWTFRIDSLTFLVSAAFLLMILPPRGRQRLAEVAGTATSGWWRNMREGVRYVQAHRRVIHLIVLTALFWAAASIFNSVTTPLVFTHYGVKDFAVLGLFRGTLAGGMVIGAILLTVFGDALRSEIAITWSLLVCGLSMFGLAWTDSIRIGSALAIFAGMGGAGILISVSTLTQRIVPDYARGRVFGLSDWASMSGLLLATGILGLVPFPKGVLDAIAPYILMVTGIAILIAWAAVVAYRQRRAPYGPWIAFWKNFTTFYCNWWFRLKRVGTCTIPPAGPVIIAANHTSPIDPFLMLSASPNRLFGFLVAQEYYRLPVFGYLIKLNECIPTTRSGVDTAATRAALRRLKNGGALGIFPQGRIQLADETLGAKEGVALLALRTRTPVVPVHISGVHYDGNVPITFVRRHHARIRFGKPIDLSPYYDRQRDRQVQREVAELIMERIWELAPEADNQLVDRGQIDDGAS
ncbi:MAG: MFS transporter [Phycisphaerae bacterium]|nr:MFS transporter [Phycisphaerae bacterium]